MKMVRQRMIKPFKKVAPLGTLLLITTSLILSSCNPSSVKSSGRRAENGSYTGENYANRAFVYKESPSILGGSHFKPPLTMNSFISDLEIITTNNKLTGNCTMSFFNSTLPGSAINDCIHSFVSKELPAQDLPRKADGSWVFPADTTEFYQTNALYHVQKGVDKFHEKLAFAYSQLYNPLITATNTAKSIPPYLEFSKLYWFKSIPSSNLYFKTDYLSIYSQCNFELNASFSPAGPDLCFGGWKTHPSFFIVQDPSVIYHELGHALVSIMMNLRNGDASTYHAFRSNLGNYGYDEAASINEGIADYYSYLMNKRTHFGEWGLGVPSNQSRPMHEDDPMHISGIDSTSEGRLSYPQYLHYDPNDPNVPYEDVHYAGQIVSHYLVALTESLKNKCSLGSDDNEKHENSTNYVMLVLAETLSELGDLNAKGVDNYIYRVPASGSYYFNNLDKESSYLWTQIVNPPTYRRFFQVMGKNINKYITTASACKGKFDKNTSEKLLDDYGLLLFKSYNDNGNSTISRSVTTNTLSPAVYAPSKPTTVEESNRRKSVLISKELISLATTNEEADRATYYIIDDKSSIESLLSNLLFKGVPVTLSKNVAGVGYNNGNIKISPGEVVAVIPNLYNSSNSTMAGVHLLATDWDHVFVNTTTGNYQPCVLDNVTTKDEGGVIGKDKDGTVLNNCGSTMLDYIRMKKGSPYPAEASAPVCMVQLEEGDSTKWVSQNEFRYKQGLALQDKDCLGYSSDNNASISDLTYNPHECLVRMLPGVNKAFFSKIDPQKSYVETVRSNNPKHKFDVGNALIFEVNKWIPPGTKFRCRLRARFSNCSDCYTNASVPDKDDFLDHEYNGADPYKIINFEFDVND